MTETADTEDRSQTPKIGVELRELYRQRAELDAREHQLLTEALVRQRLNAVELADLAGIPVQRFYYWRHRAKRLREQSASDASTPTTA